MRICDAQPSFEQRHYRAVGKNLDCELSALYRCIGETGLDLERMRAPREHADDAGDEAQQCTLLGRGIEDLGCGATSELDRYATLEQHHGAISLADAQGIANAKHVALANRLPIGIDSSLDHRVDGNNASGRLLAAILCRR
jgi:hypothetical protein